MTKENYQLLEKQIQALYDEHEDIITNLSNISALLNQFLENINWVGFYFARKDALHLGPFQGLPACVRILYEKGVCGKAASTLTTQRIDDVHQFPGHIACDSASNSEIVIPIMKNGKLFAVLDIDSPIYHRFSIEEAQMLERIVKIIEENIKEDR